MAMVNGSLVRCVKHPSHISTGFCSFCLLERLSTVGLTKSNPEKNKTDDLNGETLEISIESPKFEETKEKTKTTLLTLFELDDLKIKNAEKPESKGDFEDGFESSEVIMKNGASRENNESHSRCSMEIPRENQLKRSSSLRCACEWIACCTCELGKKSYNWSKVWDNSIIRKQSIVLKRSFSESCKDRKLGVGRDQIANMDNVGVDSQKRQWKFGRSSSLNCSSFKPKNGNNGFLRFYFAPLKNSRRSVNKNMKKTKGLFSIFGFYDLS